MGNVFITSDLHFNHDREFVYKPRGFNSVEEMNHAIIERWNSVVTNEDLVYVLGDICLGGGAEEIREENKKLIEELNGTLIIVTGNHDTDARIEMYKSCKNVREVTECAKKIKYDGYNFYLSHYITLTSNLENGVPLKQRVVNLFGHTHQQSNFYMDMPWQYHVGVDSHNCYPVSMEDVIRECEEKFKECVREL